MKTTRCPIRSEKKIGPVTSHISANNRLVKSLSHFFFYLTFMSRGCVDRAAVRGNKTAKPAAVVRVPLQNLSA